jgi:hypothetical protein
MSSVLMAWTAPPPGAFGGGSRRYVLVGHISIRTFLSSSLPRRASTPAS